MDTLNCYKYKSNITTSISVKRRDEEDYLALRQLLSRHRISVGEYLIDAYRELDKGAPDAQRLKALAWSWGMNLTQHHRKLIDALSRKQRLEGGEFLLLLLLQEYRATFGKEYKFWYYEK